MLNNNIFQGYEDFQQEKDYEELKKSVRIFLIYLCSKKKTRGDFPCTPCIHYFGVVGELN